MPNYKIIDADKFDSDLKTLADGIRAKLNNKSPLHFPDEMAEAIRTRGAKLIPKTITENGEYYAESDGADGYSPLTVNVPDPTELYFEGGLTELNLPRITSIKLYAFFKDSKVTKVTAPNVTKIGTMAFADSKIATLDAPNLEEIGDSAFNDSLFDCGGSLPQSVKKIGRNAFSSCDRLVLHSLPESLETIGDAPFKYCSNVYISTFPYRVQSIGAEALSGGVRTITFKGIPSDISSSAFSLIKDVVSTINVPWAEGWVANAPWGATNATINYEHFESDETLRGTWRIKDDVIPYLPSREGSAINFEMPFTCDGVHYDYIQFYFYDGKGEIYYGNEDDEVRAFGWCYNDETEWYGWENDAMKVITVDSDWADLHGNDYYEEVDMPTFLFRTWLLNNATKQ